MTETDNKTDDKTELRRYHIHKCPGHLMPFPDRDHKAHFWLCHNPHCDESNEYMCGIIADVLYVMAQGRVKGGTVTGERKRGL